MTSATPGYLEWLHGLASRYRASQIKAATAVNSEMLKFYWSLGADIVRMEPNQPWGSKFMQHLSEDIRREIPGAGCFSRINLYYMPLPSHRHGVNNLVRRRGGLPAPNV